MTQDSVTPQDREHQKRTPTDRKQNARGRQRRPWILVGVGLIVVVLVGTFVLRPRSKATSASAAGLANDPSIGPPTARVTIVEYGDFGCPTCRAWYQSGVLQQVLAQYGNKVRFMWRDFPVITDQSPKAAEAARCANGQGKFWQYHDLLYEHQPALSVSDLKSYAAQLGLDTVKFNQCLDSGQHRADVDRDWQDALAHHFTGTPSFLVNNQPQIGPPSLQELQSLINPIIASAK